MAKRHFAVFVDIPKDETEKEKGQAKCVTSNMFTVFHLQLLLASSKTILKKGVLDNIEAWLLRSAFALTLLAQHRAIRRPWASNLRKSTLEHVGLWL